MYESDGILLFVAYSLVCENVRVMEGNEKRAVTVAASKNLSKLHDLGRFPKD